MMFPMMTPAAVAEWEKVSPLVRDGLGIEPGEDVALWCARWGAYSRSVTVDELTDAVHDGLQRKLRDNGRTERRLLTSEELANELQVRPSTIRQWRYDGVGPRSILIGKHRRYRRADVDAWIEEQIEKNRSTRRVSRRDASS